MPSAIFKRNLESINVELSDKQIEQLDKYYEILVEWNSFMNLTSITDFDEVITKADFISLHVPAQDWYILGEKEFAKMKDGVIVINTARGGVVDEKALVDAIEDGKVAGAALDVFENEPTPEMGLLMNESLSLSPHIAGSTNEAQDRIGTELASQIVEIYGK